MRVPVASALTGLAALVAGILASPAAHAQQVAAAVPASGSPPVVGLQVGHWQASLLPQELADLRDNNGAIAGNFRELDVNYAATQAAAQVLRAAGVQVDILPSTIPAGYRADAFVAIHADQDLAGHWRGYKVAPSSLTKDSADSSLLASDLAATYAADTGLPPDLHPEAITPDMRFYYAFNWRHFQHAIDPYTPAAIIELGFITDPSDRDLLFGHPDQVGQDVASGILQYLQDKSGFTAGFSSQS